MFCFLLEPYSTMRYHRELQERRKHPRVLVHGSGYLFRSCGEEIVRVIILNLCIAGFGCRSREDFVRGERVNCVIAIDGGSSGANLHLLCRAVALRVEETGDVAQPFFIAFQIQEYHVIHSGGAARAQENDRSFF